MKQNVITISTNDLLSVQQAAEMLKRPRVTVYRWVKSGKITGVKFGGIVYIPRSEIEQLKGGLWQEGA